MYDGVDTRRRIWGSRSTTTATITTIITPTSTLASVTITFEGMTAAFSDVEDKWECLATEVGVDVVVLLARGVGVAVVVVVGVLVVVGGVLGVVGLLFVGGVLGVGRVLRVDGILFVSVMVSNGGGGESLIVDGEPLVFGVGLISDSSLYNTAGLSIVVV